MRVVILLMIAVCITILLSWTVPPRAAWQFQLDADLFAQVDAYLEANAQALGGPGLSLAIIREGEIVHTRGFGAADGGGRSITPQTPFVIGSVSKPVTAAAILQLAEAGKVELDAPVRRYIPWFRVADAEASAQITLRHLLNHTSGIPWEAGHVVMTGDGSATMEQLVRPMAGLRLHGQPGKKFEYSNLNYVILGLMIEQVTGQTYGEYLQEAILAPLGMERTYTIEREAVAAGLATPHRSWFGRLIPTSQPFLAGAVSTGHLVSTAEDLARFLAAQHQTSPADGARPYSMGWRRDTFYGQPMLRHEGAAPGFRSAVYLLPDAGWGVVLLANADGYQTLGPLIERTAWGVGALLLGQEPELPGEAYRRQCLLLNLLMGGGLLLVLLWLTLLSWLRGAALPYSWAVVTPTVFSLAALAFGLLMTPRLAQTSWAIILRYQPDLGWSVLLLSATIGLGGIWHWLLAARPR